MAVINVICILAGLALLGGAYTRAEWLLESKKGRLWAEALGEKHTRRLYMGAGLILIATGIAMYFV